MNFSYQDSKPVFGCDRRSGIDRRKFSYACHIPERRSGKRDRRRGMDGMTGDWIWLRDETAAAGELKSI